MKYALLILLCITQFVIIKLAHESGRLDGMSELLDKMEKDLKDLHSKED